MKRAILGSVVLIGLLAACGDGDGSSDDGGPGGDGGAGTWITNEQRSAAMNRYMEAFCRNQARCLNPAYFQDCNANDLATFCGGGTAETIDDLDACLKALADPDCDAAELSACLSARNALRAAGPNRLLGEGEACGPSNAIRCDYYLFCDADPNECGSCRKLGDAGDACRDTSECSRATYCANGQCAPRLAEGKACDPADFACALELVCNGGVCAEDSNRVSPALLGEACDDDTICYSGVCEGGKCVARTACGAGREGDRCSSASSCTKGYTCGAGRCVPELEDGDSCDPASTPCAQGSACFAGTCAPKLEDGAACEYITGGYSAECSSGFCRPIGTCGPHELICEQP